MDDNPYRSPRADLEPVLAPVASGLVESGSLYRKVYLPPPLDLVIEYQGIGWGETVSVNGAVADWKLSILWFSPRFDFVVPTSQGELPMSVEVSVGFAFSICSFVIRAAGEEVYSEGPGASSCNSGS